MSTARQNPKWWQLYLALPAFIGLFYRETLARFTEPEHVLAELGILFLIFGSVRLWLRANRSALMASDASEAGWGVGVYESWMSAGADDLDEDRRERPMQQNLASTGEAARNETIQWAVPERQASFFVHRRVVSRKE